MAVPGLGSGDDKDANKTGYPPVTPKPISLKKIQEELASGYWFQAIENLEALEAQYPFGDYAEQAQLELIYAYFRSQD